MKKTTLIKLEIWWLTFPPHRWLWNWRHRKLLEKAREILDMEFKKINT